TAVPTFSSPSAAARSFSGAASMSVSTSLTPCRASARAVSAPIPRAAPVISATFPANLRIQHLPAIWNRSVSTLHLELAGVNICGVTSVQAGRTYRGAGPRQRQDEPRARLVDAAVEVFGTTGSRSATVDRVCAVAGLTKRYFYESFDDSEALLLGASRHSIQKPHATLGA